MRPMFLLGLAIIAVTAPLVAADGYGGMFDNVDVEKKVNDDALFNADIDCLLDKGPCSSDLIKEFKKILPEIISTACGKCTALEKEKVRKMVSAIYEKKPNKAIEFHKKYDPTGEYEPKFAAFLVAKDD